MFLFCKKIILVAFVSTFVFCKISLAAGVDVSSVAESIMPSVIRINATKLYVKNDSQIQKAKQIEELFSILGLKDPDASGNAVSDDKTTSIGSGFFISKDGYIVTNHHVIENAIRIEVITNDEKTYNANIVASDKQTDIAVIKLTNLKYSEQDIFKPVRFADSNDVKIGTGVLVAGNPFGLGTSITAGIVSARNRILNSSPYNDYIQTDASINFGNSGGPLFNLSGDVIGINTAIYSNNSGSNFGIGFAVPSNVVKDIAERLIKDKKITRAWLGVSVSQVSNKIAESTYYKGNGGAFVNKITDGSPAHLADIKEMDIITEVAGKKIEDFSSLPIIVSGLSLVDEITIKLFRFGKELEVKLKLAELPSEKQISDKKPKQTQTEDKQATVSGLSVSNAVDGKGVVVRSIDASSEVFNSKLKKGMIIKQIDSYQVTNIDSFVETLTKIFSESRYTVLIKLSDGKTEDIVPVSFK